MALDACQGCHRTLHPKCKPVKLFTDFFGSGSNLWIRCNTVSSCLNRRRAYAAGWWMDFELIYIGAGFHHSPCSAHQAAPKQRL